MQAPKDVKGFGMTFGAQYVNLAFFLIQLKHTETRKNYWEIHMLCTYTDHLNEENWFAMGVSKLANFTAMRWSKYNPY